MNIPQAPSHFHCSHFELLEPRIAPATFVVNSLEDLPFFDPGYEGTLRWAIFESNANGPGKDTIVFDPNIFVEGSIIELTQGALPAIAGNLLIKGPGADRVTIDAVEASRIFTIDDGDPDVVRKVTISGVALTGGSALYGGAIHSTESLTIINSVIADNKAVTQGGGVSVASPGALQIRDSVISGNTAGQLGGGVFAQSNAKVSIAGSLFTGNAADSSGGGAHVTLLGLSRGNALSIVGSTFSGNVALAGNGGGLDVLSYATGKSVTITQTHFVANESGGSGGGLAIDAESDPGPARVFLGGVVVTGNFAAGYGGGGGMSLYAADESTRFTIRGAEIHNNTAKATDLPGAGNGGGILARGPGDFEIVNAVLSGNLAKGNFDTNTTLYEGGAGGGIHAFQVGELSVKSSVLAGNVATDRGGGVNIDEGTAVVRGTDFLGNHIATEIAGLTTGGGGIATQNTALSLSQSSFMGNLAGPGPGGGLYHGPLGGELTIKATNFQGNSGAVGGGAFLFPGASDAVVSKSSFTGNAALAEGGGLAASLPDGAGLLLRGVFVAGNSAANGGGLDINGGTDSDFRLVKSVVQNNHAFADGAGVFLSGDLGASILNSTIIGNVAGLSGGGILSGSTEPVLIAKSTVTGNMGSIAGGITNFGFNEIQLNNTKVFGNFSYDNPSLSHSNISGGLFTGYVEVPARNLKGTHVVTSLDDAGAGTLREAIELANASGKSAVVVFDPDLKGTISLASALPTVEGALAIKGPGADRIVIDGKGNQILVIDNFTTGGSPAKTLVSGLGFVGGSSASTGGAIDAETDRLTLEKVFFTNNAAGYGGAVFAQADVLEIRDALFAGNLVSVLGGALDAQVDGRLSVSGTMFANNSAAVGGGANLGVAGALSMNDTVFVANAGSSGGGGLAVLDLGAKIKLSDGILAGNTAGGDGGGLRLVSPNSDFPGALLKGLLLANNGSDDAGGGAFFSVNSNATLRDVIIAGNSASAGGGFHATGIGELVVSNSALAGNTADDHGGGFSAQGVPVPADLTVKIAKTTVAGNVAGDSGGGAQLRFETALAEITSSIFLGNSAKQDGGGILVDEAASLTLINSKLSGNTAGLRGGGIAGLNGSSLVLTGTTLTGNFAYSGGGGLYQREGAFTRISNTTFLANHANAVSGGAYISHNQGEILLRQVGFSSNFSGGGFGGLSVNADATAASNLTALAVVRNAAGAADAGGLALLGDGTHEVSKSTIRQNSAAGAGGGTLLLGGVGATFDFVKTEISGNVALGKGGGLYSFNPFSQSGLSVTGNWAPENPNIFAT